MERNRRRSSGDHGRGSASSLSAAEEREVTTRAVQSVVRRLGVVLGAAHSAAESELIRHGMSQTATELRDSLKPLIDALVHFEVGDADGEV